jgi:ABC-type multidrug transport system fused ATPase/permease subunit
MSSTATSTTPVVRTDHSPAGAFTSVLNASVGSAAAKLEQKIVVWADKLNGVAAGGSSSGGLAALADEGLDELAEGGGAKQKAGAEGVKAGLHGENPVWAAIKGAWQAGTPVVRAAIIAAVASVILLLLMSPALLLVFLLSLLIIAAVHRARATKR